LHANLRYAEQASKAGKAINLMAASHVGPAGRQDHDVREGACSGGCAQQDKVWRYAERGPPLDDADVLWEV
jgi:hypothetical protein